MTANAVATASIHSGTSGGQISGIRKPDTKKPSFTSWPRTWAKMNSIPKPTTYVTISIGSTLVQPNQK